MQLSDAPSIGTMLKEATTGYHKADAILARSPAHKDRMVTTLRTGEQSSPAQNSETHQVRRSLKILEPAPTTPVKLPSGHGLTSERPVPPVTGGTLQTPLHASPTDGLGFLAGLGAEGEQRRQRVREAQRDEFAKHVAKAPSSRASPAAPVGSGTPPGRRRPRGFEGLGNEGESRRQEARRLEREMFTRHAAEAIQPVRRSGSHAAVGFFDAFGEEGEGRRARAQQQQRVDFESHITQAPSASTRRTDPSAGAPPGAFFASMGTGAKKKQELLDEYKKHYAQEVAQPPPAPKDRDFATRGATRPEELMGRSHALRRAKLAEEFKREAQINMASEETRRTRRRAPWEEGMEGTAQHREPGPMRGMATRMWENHHMKDEQVRNMLKADMQRHLAQPVVPKMSQRAEATSSTELYRILNLPRGGVDSYLDAVVQAGPAEPTLAASGSAARLRGYDGQSDAVPSKPGVPPRYVGAASGNRGGSDWAPFKQYLGQ